MKPKPDPPRATFRLDPRPRHVEFRMTGRTYCGRRVGPLIVSTTDRADPHLCKTCLKGIRRESRS